MSESIDVSLLRVPYESLKRTSRDRKYIIDDLLAISRLVKETADRPCSDAERIVVIDGLVDRVRALGESLQQTTELETGDARRCRTRLQHLKDLGHPPKDGVLDWNQKRLPRILVDHLLRSGHTRTAAMLVESAQLHDLVDQHVFEEAQPILAGLRRHDCGPALAWCATNRAKLKKVKSKLEFRLRLQEFTELVRRGEKLKALAHSKQHLAPWAGLYLADLQRAVASLVYGAGTTCEPYRTLFDPGQWGAATALFLQELYRLHSMTQQSLLAIQLQAGLSALKAPPGATEHESKEDPLHHEDFQALAHGLPYAKHVHSRLVCAITKEIMNEHNPPIVLPNGTVYSEKAIRLGTIDGHFKDPVSGETFPRTGMRRAYIS